MEPGCSLELTPEEEAEMAELLKQWFPWWRKPITPDEWDQLVHQHRAIAISAKETHELTVSSNAPMFLRRMARKSRYRTGRRCLRTLRRAEVEKQLMYRNLMRAIGLTQPE